MFNPWLTTNLILLFCLEGDSVCACVRLKLENYYSDRYETYTHCTKHPRKCVDLLSELYVTFWPHYVTFTLNLIDYPRIWGNIVIIHLKSCMMSVFSHIIQTLIHGSLQNLHTVCKISEWVHRKNAYSSDTCIFSFLYGHFYFKSVAKSIPGRVIIINEISCMKLRHVQTFILHWYFNLRLGQR